MWKPALAVLSATTFGLLGAHSDVALLRTFPPSPCASDTSWYAKAMLNRYRTMMDDDSMSVVERRIVGIDNVDSTTVAIVTDTTVCRAALIAYGRALSDTTANRPVHVVKVGNHYIVHEPASPVGRSGYVVLDGGMAYLTFDSTFTTKLAQTR